MSHHEFLKTVNSKDTLWIIKWTQKKSRNIFWNISMKCQGILKETYFEISWWTIRYFQKSIFENVPKNIRVIPEKTFEGPQYIVRDIHKKHLRLKDKLWSRPNEPLGDFEKCNFVKIPWTTLKDKLLRGPNECIGEFWKSTV